MLKLLVCFAGAFLLLLIAEAGWRGKTLKGETHRKFVHITVGSFVAFWPWFISFRTITIIGVLMLVGVLLNRRLQVFHYAKNIERETYGDIFFALAIIAASLLTANKVYFALAILHMALADGLAALIGKKFGGPWTYRIRNQTKTLVGSMSFWVTSLCILGAGGLFSSSTISFEGYLILLILLPPVLTAVENLSSKGLDNLLLPIAAIAALNLAELI
jgi:phytol kinase